MGRLESAYDGATFGVLVQILNSLILTVALAR
jgi:hypothetical protein